MNPIAKTTDLVIFNESFTIRRRDSEESTEQHIQCIKLCLDENQEMTLTVEESFNDLSKKNNKNNDIDSHTMKLHSSTAYELAKRIIRLCDQYDSQVDYSSISDYSCKSL
jgi:hypothetical protein